MPGKHVDHMHPNAIISIAASQALRGADAGNLRRRHGLRAVAAPRLRARPRDAGDRRRRTRSASAIMMGQHGFITWADDDKACYTLHARLHREGRRLHRGEIRGQGRRRRRPSAARNTRRSRRRSATRRSPAILPWLRGQVSPAEALHRHRAGRREDPALRELATTPPRLAELGTSCPDHFLRTKIKPLYVAWNPQTDDLAALKKKLAAGLEQYRKDYAAYYDEVQTRQLARDARPEPDRHPHPRPRHDRLGQGQERVAASPPSSTTAPSR